MVHRTSVRALVASAIALAACSTAGSAQAQIFIDVFGGQTWTTRTDLQLRTDQTTVDQNDVPVGVSADIQGLKPKNSNSFGGRIGFWAGNLGFAIDGSTLNLNLRPATVTATANANFDEIFDLPVSIGIGENIQVDLPALPVPTTVTLAGLAMVRMPIGKTADRGRGVIEPYAFGGPVWLVTNERFDGKIGLRLGGGLRLPIGNNLALFGEYRYTAVDKADVKAGTFRTTINGVVASTDIVGRINIRNHAGVAGVSLLF